MRKDNPQAAPGSVCAGVPLPDPGALRRRDEHTQARWSSLKPSDTLSAKLLEELEAAGKNASATAATNPAQSSSAVESVPATSSVPPEGATISGAWTTQPNPDTSVALTIQAAGEFHWQVVQKGQTRQFSGHSTFGNGILTLAPDKGLPIVGRVGWTDATQHDLPCHRRQPRCARAELLEVIRNPAASSLKGRSLSDLC